MNYDQRTTVVFWQIVYGSYNYEEITALQALRAELSRGKRWR